jgi:UDP-galactopyranose mutase
MSENYDVCIVGAGLSGAVLAERLASIGNKKVLIVEKRDHIGGNCYDFIDENGILINRYGAHLFHTNDLEVWKYVQQFSQWKWWNHKVLGCINGDYFNIPVNINTVNALMGQFIHSEEEMKQWLEKNQVKYNKISNGEEIAKSRVGEVLYEKIFKHYTYKQWNKYPSELDSSVLARIPIRTNYNENYFNDKYQALPVGGYTHFFKNLLSHQNISILLNIDFFSLDKNITYNTLFFTGCIDEFFKETHLEKLEYRSIEFVVEHHKNTRYFQPNSVVNYPDASVNFTRIVEYKHFFNQTSNHTTIVKEFTNSNGDPYYPVINNKNLVLFKKYKELAQKEPNVHFLGRLANFKYINMDESIKNALKLFTKMCQNGLHENNTITI